MHGATLCVEIEYEAKSNINVSSTTFSLWKNFYLQHTSTTYITYSTALLRHWHYNNSTFKAILTLLTLQYLLYLEYGTILNLLKIQHNTSFLNKIIFSSVSIYLKFYLDEKSHMQIFQYYNETLGSFVRQQNQVFFLICGFY